MDVLTTFWWLLCAHAMTDYVFQSDIMGKKKRPDPFFHRDYPIEEYGPWWWWMAAHGLVNALGVLYVTQNIILSVGEFFVHCMLDTAKCRGWINTNTDQVGHLISKLMWAFLA